MVTVYELFITLETVSIVTVARQPLNYITLWKYFTMVIVLQTVYHQVVYKQFP